MKKIIFVLVIVLIILGAWFFMQPKEMVTQDSLGPNPVSAKETKVGDRIGAFEVSEMQVGPTSITATFIGTATVNVVCLYSDMSGYVCTPDDESAKQAIPRFIELEDIGSQKSFSVIGEGTSFDAFKKNFEIVSGGNGSAVPLRITITDYATRSGDTTIMSRARLVEVVE